MKPSMRKYQKDEDYWKIRNFLREVLLLNNRQQISWDLARFDYWRWHGILNMKDGTLEDDVFIWENEVGNMTAVLNREAPGSVFLQIRPDVCTIDLIDEMVSVAEQYLTAPTKNSRRTLHIWAEKQDMQLRGILKNRGYAFPKNRKPEHQRRCFLNQPISKHPVADGYTIRSMGDVDEHHTRCWVSWRAFHPNEPDNNFEDGWYHNIQRAPLYRRDLDLVAVAPGDDLAAFCTIWFDDVTRTGLFEPVGTAPEHQRHGLGKAIISEGLTRLKHLGANLAYVGSGSDPAHALYASAGFKTYRILEPWVKEI